MIYLCLFEYFTVVMVSYRYLFEEGELPFGERCSAAILWPIFWPLGLFIDLYGLVATHFCSQKSS